MKNDAGTIPAERIEIRNCYDETETANLKTTRNPRIQESHPEREILFVVSGKNNFLLNGRIYSAVPGDAFFINHWIPHQCDYGTIKTDFRHIWIHVHEKRLFGSVYRNLHPGHTSRILNWEHSGHLLGLLNERWDRALQERGHSAARKEIYLSIARILSEEIAYLTAHEPDETRSNTGKIAAWIKNHISIQYGRNASMAELEKLTGYNRFYLMRLFKAEYGMTIGEYVNCVRRGFIAGAAGKDLRQKEIAAMLGFKSAAAFWLWKKRNSSRNPASKAPLDPARKTTGCP